MHLIASFPSPPRGSIPLGPLDLRAYGLMIAFGVILAVYILGRRLDFYKLGDADDASSIAMWSVTAGIIGARLYHVATDWYRFSDNLSAIPKLWEGGLGIPGGLLAGIAVGAWQGKRRGIAPAKLLTCAAPAIPAAQAIGRWGNWFNQELYGKATDLPWALEIDDAHQPAGAVTGTTYHPTFLYESLWNVALVGVLFWVQRTYKLGPGRLMAVYIMGYGAGRFWVEGLRVDASRHVAGLRWNQWVALAAIVGGLLYLLATWGKKWPEDVTDDGDPEAEETDNDEFDLDITDTDDITGNYTDTGIDDTTDTSI